MTFLTSRKLRNRLYWYSVKLRRHSNQFSINHTAASRAAVMLVVSAKGADKVLVYLGGKSTTYHWGQHRRPLRRAVR